jgi:hypothetical protein
LGTRSGLHFSAQHLWQAVKRMGFWLIQKGNFPALPEDVYSAICQVSFSSRKAPANALRNPVRRSCRVRTSSLSFFSSQRPISCLAGLDSINIGQSQRRKANQELHRSTFAAKLIECRLHPSLKHRVSIPDSNGERFTGRDVKLSRRAVFSNRYGVRKSLAILAGQGSYNAERWQSPVECT